MAKEQIKLEVAYMISSHSGIEFCASSVKDIQAAMQRFAEESGQSFEDWRYEEEEERGSCRIGETYYSFVGVSHPEDWKRPPLFLER